MFFCSSDGIRPYVEVWQGDHKVLCSMQDFDSMKLFMPHDNKIVFPLNLHLVGDICIYVFHARRVMGKVSGIKVVQIQLHTGFIQETETNLQYSL